MDKFFLPNPFIESRMWHKDNLYVEYICFSSEFSFSYTGCFAKTKEYCLSYYLPIARRWSKDRLMFFLWDISAKWNVKNLVQNLNSIHRGPFP